MRPRTSTRDVSVLRASLARWLQGRLGADHEPDVVLMGGPAGAGMSSETVLLDLAWVVAGTEHRGSFVLRLPPPADSLPLFPEYSLERQVRVMQIVGERSAVKVPRIIGYDADETALGSPFFVMERIDGTAAPDLPPYVFGSWLTEASSSQRDRVEHAMVDVLAGIHGVPLTEDDFAFLDFPLDGDTALRRHVANQRAYLGWICRDGGQAFPLIDAVFAWLEDRWPDAHDEATLSWGDARLANVLFRDFEPVGVLDWEAAAIGPRELDIGWFLFFHQYFQRVALRYGYVGLPDFLDVERFVEEYTARTGYVVRDLGWFLVYAELRQALTSIRVSSRAVHFGERPAPDDPQDLIIDRQHLEQILETT